MFKFLRLNHFSLTLGLLLIVPTLHATQNPIIKKTFPPKEGILHYQITGSEQGRQTTYIRNYGKERLIYRVSYGHFISADSKQVNITLYRDGYHYLIDLKHQQAIQIKDKCLTTPAPSEPTQHYPIETIMISDKGEEQTRSTQGKILLDAQISILGYHRDIQLTHIEEKILSDEDFDILKDLKILKAPSEVTPIDL